MQRFSLPDKNIFLTPQDSETSLEAKFRSKGRPAFYLPQRQYLCIEKSLHTKYFLQYKVRKRRKAS